MGGSAYACMCVCEKKKINFIILQIFHIRSTPRKHTALQPFQIKFLVNHKVFKWGATLRCTSRHASLLYWGSRLSSLPAYLRNIADEWSERRWYHRTEEWGGAPVNPFPRVNDSERNCLKYKSWQRKSFSKPEPVCWHPLYSAHTLRR